MESALPPKRIFHYKSGSLGGIRDAADPRSALDAADDICARGARELGLVGVFKAWLSTSTVDAIDRLAEVGPWYRLDGQTKLFENKSQFRVGPSAPISAIPDQEDRRNLFWTGTLADGTKSHLDCMDWTEYQPFTLMGSVGRADSAAGAWLNPTPVSCGTYLALLCIEQ